METVSQSHSLPLGSVHLLKGDLSGSSLDLPQDPRSSSKHRGTAWEEDWLALEEDFGLPLEWAKSFRFGTKPFLQSVLLPGAYLLLRACGGIQQLNEKSEALGPGRTHHGHHM